MRTTRKCLGFHFAYFEWFAVKISASLHCYPEKLCSFVKIFATKERKERKEKNLPGLLFCVPCVLLRQFSFGCGFAALGLCLFPPSRLPAFAPKLRHGPAVALSVGGHVELLDG